MEADQHDKLQFCKLVFRRRIDVQLLTHVDFIDEYAPELEGWQHDYQEIATTIILW